MINKGLIATKGNHEMATLTPKEIAVKFDTDARTVRKFLRSEGTRVGKGHRHAIDSKSLKSLAKRFDAWNAARAAAKDADATDADEVTEGDEVITEGDDTDTLD